MFAVSVSLATTAGTARVLDGSVTFDRNWAPWGQARFVIPLADWYDLDVDPFEVSPVTIQLECMDDGVAASTAWRFYLFKLETSEVEQTAEVQLSTWEQVLMDTYNGGAAYKPGMASTFTFPLLFSTFNNDVGTGLMSSVVEPGTTLEWGKLAFWYNGESAWDYLERYREMAGVAYHAELDPLAPEHCHIQSLPDVTTAPMPSNLLSHRQEYGPPEYADQLTTVWKWSEVGNDYEDQEIKWPGGVSFPHLVRYPRTIERLGPPVDGWTQKAVDRMYRHRYLHHISLPMSRFAITTDPHARPWRSTTLTFGDVPTLEGVLIREFP